MCCETQEDDLYERKETQRNTSHIIVPQFRFWRLYLFNFNYFCFYFFRATTSSRKTRDIIAYEFMIELREWNGSATIRTLLQNMRTARRYGRV